MKTSKMALWIKARDTSPDSLNLIPQTHMVE